MTYKFDIVKHRKVYFLIALVMMALSVASLLIQGLNLGIDFKSGTRLDIQIGPNVELEKGKQVLESLGYDNPNARIGGTNQNILIFRTDETITQQDKQTIVDAFNKAFQTNVSIQEQVVDPIIGREMARNAIISVLLASIGIILYVAFRFEFRFGVAAILALFFDAMITIGIFSLLQLEVDLVFIAAMLTIIGYSVNDTIVIFDRIRENLVLFKPTKWEELAKVVNDSIHQTITRSLNTMITVVFGALFLWILGGESIRNFSFALLIGLISGAFSSIFLASPVWIGWKWRSMKKQKSQPVSE